MPTITVYPHGGTAGIPPTTSDHVRAKRGKVGGWSPSSIRSNTRFLYRVQPEGLTGMGWALSLTLRDCPESHDDWHRLRRAFIERMRRMGMLRMHWLTEWQRRGVPHLHAALWLPWPDDLSEVYVHPGDPFLRGSERRYGRRAQLGAWLLRSRIIGAWLELAAPYGAGPGGQHAEPITAAVGWFKYLSKHASRGLHHYQRSPEAIPAGWQRTGRMWGHLGDWPLATAQRFRASHAAFWTYRRIIRRYRLADARSGLPGRVARRRIVQARRMLRDSDRTRSSIRGVSEWVPDLVQHRILAGLAAAGYGVDLEP